jgi:hypothetical protein
MSSPLRRHWLGLLMALTAATVLLWNLARPALWLDESATAAATKRSWSDLWLLLSGSDAPLVPYYALLKATTAPVIHFWPQVQDHPELLLRTPSVMALTIAVWAMTVWLARHGSAALALAAGTVLITTFAFSRYGQEARPYAFVMAAAVISTIGWSRLILSSGWSGWGWYLFYPLSIMFLTTANSLAASLIAAHLVAALAVSGRGRRLASIARTLIGAVIGLALVAPLTITAVKHGGGANSYPKLTAENLFHAFVFLFSRGSPPLWHVGALLPLSVLALPQAFRPRYSFIARIALAWALVPPAVLLPAVMSRPNLLLGRYLLFVVPAWAVLCGLGVVTLMNVVDWAVTSIANSWSGSGIGARRVAVGLAWSLAVAVLTTTTLQQLPFLRSIRTSTGHGENIRPALAAASTAQTRSLPIVMSSHRGTIEVLAYSRPGFEPDTRLLGDYPQTTMPDIWPMPMPPRDRKVVIRAQSEIVLLWRRNPGDPHCPLRAAATPDFVHACMPGQLRDLNFQVVRADDGETGWVFALLHRRPTRADLRHQPTHH